MEQKILNNRQVIEKTWTQTKTQLIVVLNERQDPDGETRDEMERSGHPA